MNTNNQPNVAVEATVEETVQAKKARITKERNDLSVSIKMLTASIKDLNKLDSAVVSSKDADLIRFNDQLKEKENKKAEKETELDNLESEEKNAEKIATNKKIKDAVKQYLADNPSIAYIGDQDMYYYIAERASTSRKQNVIEVVVSPQVFMKRIGLKYGIPVGKFRSDEVLDLVGQEGRAFERLRYSIDEKSWTETEDYLPFRHMEKHFINHAKVDRIDPNVIDYFNQLMYSLSGGKQENQTHIEQWVVHKVLNYRKTTTTPELIIVGHIGGNGKTTFQGIIGQMFPSSLTSLANIKTLSGNFNSILMGKLVVFFDDQNTKKTPLDTVKELAGASKMVVEKKGVDQETCEKTFTSAWFANDMPFELDANGGSGGVSRRFSVMRTNITFLESLRKHAAEKGEPITEDEAITISQTVMNEIFFNRECVAQWFKHLQAKHSYIDENFVLKALHGADYKYFVNQQSSSFDVVWKDLVIPSIAKGQVVPLFVIAEAMRHIDGEEDPINVKKLMGEIRSKIEVDGNYEIAKKAWVLIFPGSKTKKQCVFVKHKNKTSPNNTFDWSQVSNKAWMSNNGTEIQEDDFIFNMDLDAREENQLPKRTKLEEIRAKQGNACFEDID